MAEKKKRRKLSFLQKEYRKYFLKRLEEYNVKSPAHLDEEKKKEFFGGIPENWIKEKKALNGKRIDNIIKKGTEEASYPTTDKVYKNTDGIEYVVSSIDEGNVELVQLHDAANILICSLGNFKETYIQAITTADDDSPLNIALVEVSEALATFNALLRTVLRAAPEEVKTSAKEAIRASKVLLQKLTNEVREEY